MQILLKFFRTQFLPAWTLFGALCLVLTMRLTEASAPETTIPRHPLSQSITQPSGQSPNTAQPPTHEFHLSNGLKLIVREDHRAPVAVFQIWYKVGSSYEPSGLTGISHLLEHMMFKGTNRLKAGAFSRTVAEYGGVENASTTRDYTMYYQQWEASRIPISFELEADRMQHLSVTKTEFDKELKVVMEERRMRVDDDPHSKSYERFLESAYIASPYQQPVIGWMEDIRHLSLGDIQRWHRTWYAPNNAIIVIVGDVNASAMQKLAQRYFGAIPQKILPTIPSARDISALGERQLKLSMPAQLPLLLEAYNVPSLATAEKTDEVYALRMLAGILDSGRSARIETELVRKTQIAAGAGVEYSPFTRGDSLFTFSGIPNKGLNPDALEKAYRQMLETLKNKPVQAEEIARVKAQVISSLIYQQDSIAEQASTIGQLESVGLSWKLLDAYVNNLQTVTPEQVQAVAQKYFTASRRTITKLEPQQPRNFEKKN